MRHMKRAGFITAAISLLLLTACGDVSSSKDDPWGNSGSRNNNTSNVSISITQTLNVSVGETRTLNVTTQNTNFTVSVSPASGSGCVKSGNNAVTCTPTAAGTYTVTVRATADATKTATAALTVNPVGAGSKAILLQLVNSYRTTGRNCGDRGYFGPTSPVTWDDTLELAAYDHSLDMFTNNFLNHMGSDGSRVGDRLTRHGYKWWTLGENIGFGYATEQAAINGWIASPAHCENIMDPDFEEMGVARVWNYWTQVFSAGRVSF